MAMTGKKNTLLALVAVIVLGIGAWYIYSTVQYWHGSFPAGAPSTDLDNLIVPQQVPLGHMHPPAWLPPNMLETPMRYGGATSTVAVIMYGSANCASCRTFEQTVTRVVPQYNGAVAYVWIDQPLDANAVHDALFARCASLQGKFWQAHDAIMASGGNLTTTQEFLLANQLGLNVDVLSVCERDPDVTGPLNDDVSFNKGQGVLSTPIIFVGTQAFDAPLTASALTTDINQILHPSTNGS